MKNYFKFDVRGRDWWLPILVYWFVSVVFNIPIQIMSAQKSQPHLGTLYVIMIVFVFVLVITLSFAYIAILRIAFAKVSLGSHTFSFRGSMGRFLGINLLGVFLSIITLGIYIPWWTRKAYAYLLSEAEVDGSRPEFLGRGGRFFKYMLLCVYLPVIVFTGVLVLFGLMSAGRGAVSSTAVTFIVVLLYIVLLIAMMFFVYLTYKWMVQIRLAGRTIIWKTRFWESMGAILGQVLLTVVTVIIYFPAATLRLYRYFTARTVVQRAPAEADSSSTAGQADGSIGADASSGAAQADGEIGRLGFDGPIGKGFLLIWGQTLLTIITIGIYLPWAYARIGRWVAEHTYYERTA